MQSIFEHGTWRQLGEVLGDVDPTRVEVEDLDGLALLACAKDDPERRLLRRLALVLVEPAQVQLHLAGVGGLEVAELELDRDEPLHAPVEEQQVEIVVVSVERDPLLPLHEREAGPQLQ